MPLQQSIIRSKAPPFVVAVTGGGLYNSGFDYNSTAILKDALPDSFHRQAKPTIKILKAPENFPAEYYPSRKLIQGLWAGNLSIYDLTEEPGDDLG